MLTATDGRMTEQAGCCAKIFLGRAEKFLSFILKHCFCGFLACLPQELMNCIRRYMAAQHAAAGGGIFLM